MCSSAFIHIIAYVHLLFLFVNHVALCEYIRSYVSFDRQYELIYHVVVMTDAISK